MAISLQSLSQGVSVKAPRIVVIGVEKIGKTTFSCGGHFEGGQLASVGSNKPVIISVKGEEGADALDVAKFPTVYDFGSALDCLRALAKEEHEFETVVLDSASALEPLIWQTTCKEGDKKSIEDFGYGKGYILALEYWRQVCNGLDYLRENKGMTSIIIGHTRVKTMQDPETDPYDAYIMDIHDKAANLLFRWADVILFCNTKKIVKSETGQAVEVNAGQRYLFTRKTPSHPGGGRGVYGHLPVEIPLDWWSFQNAVNAAMENKPNKE